MSFEQFADLQYVKTFDDGEQVRMGEFQVQNNAELGNIRVLLYINEALNLAGTEQLQMKIYSDPSFQSLIYTSSLANLADITNLPTLAAKGWLGWLRMDFNRENLNKNIKYYPTITISNYTRAGSFYCGVAHDFPFPVYENGETEFFKHPIAMQIFDFRQKQLR